MIEELPDINLTIEDYYEYQDVELLDYVYEVANHFLPNIDGLPSKAPAVFCERFHERNLSIEERYERHKKFYISNLSFDDYLEYHSDEKPLKDNFMERYLSKKELQETIEAFGLDVSKLWYLLLFVHDYIEDIGNNSPTIDKSTLQDFNDFADKLSEATSITLKKDNRKSYAVEREDTIRIIQAALQHCIKIVNSGELNGTLDSHPLNLIDKSHLNTSYKKWKFAEILQYFLKDRKATKAKNCLVSKDKMLFISRLIYVAGYENDRYYESHDKDAKPNRMLSNLLRRYQKEDFPLVIGRHYTQ